MIKIGVENINLGPTRHGSKLVKIIRSSVKPTLIVLGMIGAVAGGTYAGWTAKRLINEYLQPNPNTIIHEISTHQEETKTYQQGNIIYVETYEYNKVPIGIISAEPPIKAVNLVR